MSRAQGPRNPGISERSTHRYPPAPARNSNGYGIVKCWLLRRNIEPSSRVWSVRNAIDGSLTVLALRSIDDTAHNVPLAAYYLRGGPRESLCNVAPHHLALLRIRSAGNIVLVKRQFADTLGRLSCRFNRAQARVGSIRWFQKKHAQNRRRWSLGSELHIERVVYARYCMVTRVFGLMDRIKMLDKESISPLEFGVLCGCWQPLRAVSSRRRNPSTFDVQKG